MARESKSKAPVIDPLRLCAAADAILRAIPEDQERPAVVRMLVVQTTKADSPDAFTLAELVEGMSMLIRMGLVEAARRHP